jgi:hypothetical protein
MMICEGTSALPFVRWNARNWRHKTPILSQGDWSSFAPDGGAKATGGGMQKDKQIAQNDKARYGTLWYLSFAGGRSL